MPRLTIDEAIAAIQQAQGVPIADLELVDEPLILLPDQRRDFEPILAQMSTALQTQIEFSRRAYNTWIRNQFPEAREIDAFIQRRSIAKVPCRALVFFYRFVEERGLIPFSMTCAHYWLYTSGHDHKPTVEFYEILALVYEGLELSSLRMQPPCNIVIRLPEALLARLQNTRLDLMFNPDVVTYGEMLRTRVLNTGAFNEWINACQRAQKIFVLVIAVCDGIFQPTPQMILPWFTARGKHAVSESIGHARAEYFFRVVTRLPPELQMRVVATMLPEQKNVIWGWPEQYFHIEDSDLAWLRRVVDEY